MTNAKNVTVTVIDYYGIRSLPLMTCNISTPGVFTSFFIQDCSLKKNVKKLPFIIHAVVIIALKNIRQTN